jgi:hypothetical protein
MPESNSNQQVTVTAEERAHPAIVKLARACIALARDLAGSPSAEQSSPIGAPEQPHNARSARQEGADD